MSTSGSPRCRFSRTHVVLVALRWPVCRRGRPPAHSSTGFEAGSVTAEAAIVLPIMAAFALTLVWMISIGIAHVEAVDAARDAAREIARGGDVSEATERAHATAPDDARVRIDEGGGLAVVDVTFSAQPPGWLLVPLPAVEVRASSAVEVEGDAPTR